MLDSLNFWGVLGSILVIFALLKNFKSFQFDMYTFYIEWKKSEGSSL